MRLSANAEGSLPFWGKRFAALGVDGLKADEAFGEKRPHFAGFALVEARNDTRLPWTHGGVSGENAIRGFHSASLRLSDDGATAKLLRFMGYDQVDAADDVKRFGVQHGNGADFIDVETMPAFTQARQGAGSVHHIVFAVEDRAKQIELRKALLDTGYQVTPVIDRDYFWAIYFRTPGGVLFEVATNEPRFNRDEDTAHLGEALKLPKQHEHLRDDLKKGLQPITD
jgi:glyoxalase family protein